MSSSQFVSDPKEVTQMVTNRGQHSSETRSRQASRESSPGPNEIRASTPYDFSAKNLTPYGGLLPVATMLEKVGFQLLVEEALTVGRRTRAMSMYQFVLAMVLGAYVGFSRLYHLRFVARDPILAGILKVRQLPPQSTFWRFLASLSVNAVGQILAVQRRMRERVWAAANIGLHTVTLDTDTTVHTLYGNQMGARKSYNPKNKGKKSYQPMLTFIAETREYLWGGLRNGDRPSGKEIARHIGEAVKALPARVERILSRADSGFYCWEAVEAYEKAKCRFILVARKTSRLLEELNKADWEPSPQTDADEQCEFYYQPDGWGGAYRFLALRYEVPPEEEQEEEGKSEPVQYQLFATAQYVYRVFVTNMEEPLPELVWFYGQRGSAENLIKEANNDAGLAAHPSRRFVMNQNHFQVVMLAYNLNCWLMLFNREATETTVTLRHTTLATARLRFLFVAAKIWRHAGRTGMSYADHYEEKGIFNRLMARLRAIAPSGGGFGPVIATALV
jgi:hypothetical protein